MNLQRNWVTPVTAGAFPLSAVTGVLIFFHVDSDTRRQMNVLGRVFQPGE